MQSIRSRDDPNAFARTLFDGLPERYDILADVLSFGQNARWRRAMVDRIVAAEPRRVLDVATGPAGVARQLARRTGATVVGIDITEEMVRKGVENVARDAGAAHVRLLVGRGEQLGPAVRRVGEVPGQAAFGQDVRDALHALPGDAHGPGDTGHRQRLGQHGAEHLPPGGR